MRNFIDNLSMRILPTTVDLVQQLRDRASRLHRTGKGRMQDLRDRVARRGGYSHWNHVMQCLEQTAQREYAPEFHSISTYQCIAEKVEQVGGVLENREISLHPQSVCAQIFKAAERLAAENVPSAGTVHGINEVFSMMQRR